MERRNKNRGYQQLRVWQDAISLYVETCRIYRPLGFELRRVASQAIASADSVHRNIAEGYCRRSIREYIQPLYIALGSLGESVSGHIACQKAAQINPSDFEGLDSTIFKLENGLLKLVERLETKADQGDWTDHLILKESNEIYHTTSTA